MKKNLEINWKSKPEKEDYASAKEYLALLYHEKKAAKLVSRLKKCRTMTFAAKDIFRASHLPLLDISNAQVKADHKKIVGNKKLSPLLLVRHDTTAQTIIADGYHRLCAAYSLDEDPHPVQNRLTHSGPIVADECGPFFDLCTLALLSAFCFRPPAPGSWLRPLMRRCRSPASYRQRCQHDFHCERAKDESHYTHEDGRALSTDHSQNPIRKKE